MDSTTAVPNLDLLALAKVGAYGVCIALISYTFYQNSALISRAEKLKEETLVALQKHLRLTAWTGLALLVTAAVLEAVNQVWIQGVPVTINVQLQPGDFAQTAHLLPELAKEKDAVLRFQILGDLHTYEFKDGQLSATLKGGQTVSFDLHRVSEALVASNEKLKIANQRLAGTSTFGASEPGQ